MAAVLALAAAAVIAGARARCRAAGVPQDTAFATKPALARQMITRALDAGTPAAWVTADEVYGQLCSVWETYPLTASSLGFRDKQGRTLDGV